MTLRYLLAMALFLLACSSVEAPTPTLETPTPTPIPETPTPTPLTQEEYAVRSIAALDVVGELESRADDCAGFDLNEVDVDGDPRYQAAFQAFDDLEDRVGKFRELEGIHIPQDFDVRVDRLADDDWEKLRPLMAEFLAAFEELFAAMVEVANAELHEAGCPGLLRTPKGSLTE